MISQRRLVAFLLLTSVSLAVILPFSGVGLLWAVCAPFLILFALISIFSPSVDLEEIALTDQLYLRVIGSRAPPLG